MSKKLVITVLIISLIVLMMSGCTSSGHKVQLENIKAGLEKTVSQRITNVDIPESSIKMILSSLEFTYNDPEITGDSVGFTGEFSYILGDKKYIQPFKVTGVLSDETFTMSTKGMEMRTEDLR